MTEETTTTTTTVTETHAPAPKKAVKAKAAKKAAPKKAAPKKAAKGKAKKAASGDRRPRVTQEEREARMLVALSKSKKPLVRLDLARAVLKDPGLTAEEAMNVGNINDTAAILCDRGLVKKEAAKFHEMGKGFVFTITSKGRTAASKVK